MVRFLLFLLGNLTVNRQAFGHQARHGNDEWVRSEAGALYADRSNSAGGEPGLPTDRRRAGDEDGLVQSFRERGGKGRRRGPIPPWLTWGVVAALVALVFRRAIASVVLIALSAVLHFAGFNVHLPKVSFAWPWQTISAGTTSNTDLGPWVLQKIQGITKPALGQANFTFFFTRKVSKNMGPLPCWYARTFYAVAHASAKVNLNPGPAWWAPSSGHYRLRVLSRPEAGRPGHVTVAMVLPRPQLPQSERDVAIDNISSKPMDAQHSWTYPGLVCGMLLRPQFPESVLYSEAQRIAFYKSSHAAQITRPLVRTAESEAVRIIRDNFIQPTVNAFGYTLDHFTVRWAAGS